MVLSHLPLFLLAFLVTQANSLGANVLNLTMDKCTITYNEATKN